ncbi:3-Beta-hydroxysteroid-delta(8) delta(7)-isomerase [Leishmania donovani]|uniref:3-Beta-hydroxysteroid-delta(8)_-_delta(7 )-isomerase_-_putative n=3 Tax=Leishmania donovani species complex TaxID=38574 RepID=A0A6L0WWA6_LEIIN|nr:Emopamil binding family protein [Leishmania donovani]CAC9474461.1 3-Beta-hydroxysteroid-delta(8)_-_delta(7)-isomerase_-_putative [Leishmania infantum]CAJ1987621.1 3-Beta-hydroxysteroid-delta(8) delta(7)-isomerase [Leishmania donovani]SUZ40612.1 3-Beta-hydroxysteroid-delta(8)_-_delta(7)-isomerase_-_putative [Leishmania infantum]VDZ43509.1 3-Beta-hydroxysteroid-delta(8)_delta(7)-isomerase_putative/GeneDB:LmjF.16.0340 [Leishmania donovani]
MFLEVFVDPFVLFCTLCILTPLFVARDALTTEMVQAYFREPSTACALAAVPAAWLIGIGWRWRVHRSLRQRKAYQEAHKSEMDPHELINYDSMMAPLTYEERTRARWYLLNGIVVHMFMDGCVGVFKTNPLLAENYAKVDARYASELGSLNGSAVHVVSLIELFVKGPLCVLLYWAFQVRHPMRDALEFFACVTQAYGTIVYLGQEVISGAPNLDVDHDLTFSPHHLFYFWFAVVLGCVLYLLVPAVLGWRSYVRLRNHCTFYMQHHYSRRSDGRRSGSHLAPHM